MLTQQNLMEYKEKQLENGCFFLFLRKNFCIFVKNVVEKFFLFEIILLSFAYQKQKTL